MLKLCQGVQQSVAAAACCRHLDIRVCIPGPDLPGLLGPVRAGPDGGVLHHHSGPTRPLRQGVSLRVCISVSLPRHHRLLRQASNNNRTLIDAASIISLYLSPLQDILYRSSGRTEVEREERSENIRGGREIIGGNKFEM